MNRVLVVEDEKHLAEGLRFNLEAEGYAVEVVESGEEALSLIPAAAPPFDVLVLDVMLPGKDGFTVMAELREARQFIATLFLTARGRPDDVLRGFGVGADDYLTKPFELSILIARIRGLLRRREWLEASLAGSNSKPVAVQTAEVFRFGANSEKVVNFGLLELSVADQVVRLTQMEASVLRFLIEHEGKPVSRKDMIGQVWGLHENTDTRPIDNFIVRLRRYVEDDPTRPRHLLTVRGVGYRFVASPAA
jgi:two-component system alkaline phosphatase synthesis response regulator PhoP